MSKHAIGSTQSLILKRLVKTDIDQTATQSKDDIMEQRFNENIGLLMLNSIVFNSEQTLNQA